MTVSDLIAELKKHPPYMPVVFAWPEPDYIDDDGVSSIHSVDLACSFAGRQMIVIDGPGKLE